MNFAVVYERTPKNYAAYPPELPGCGTTSKTWEGIQEMIREAITGHVELMLEDGDPVPDPQMSPNDAMAHHMGVLSEYGITALEPGTTVGMIEVDITPPQVVKAG